MHVYEYNTPSMQAMVIIKHKACLMPSLVSFSCMNQYMTKQYINGDF